MIKLQAVRESRKLTQKRLAEMSNVPQQTISALESGARRNPGVATLMRLAYALDCSIDDLYEDDGEPLRVEADNA